MVRELIFRERKDQNVIARWVEVKMPGNSTQYYLRRCIIHLSGLGFGKQGMLSKALYFQFHHNNNIKVVSEKYFRSNMRYGDLKSLRLSSTLNKSLVGHMFSKEIKFLRFDDDRNLVEYVEENGNEWKKSWDVPFLYGDEEKLYNYATQTYRDYLRTIIRYKTINYKEEVEYKTLRTFNPPNSWWETQGDIYFVPEGNITLI